LYQFSNNYSQGTYCCSRSRGPAATLAFAVINAPDFSIAPKYQRPTAPNRLRIFPNSCPIGIVGCFSGEPFIGQPLISVGVGGIHDTVDAQLLQYFGVLAVHIIHIFDQLIVLFLAGGLDHADQLGFQGFKEGMGITRCEFYFPWILAEETSEGFS